MTTPGTRDNPLRTTPDTLPSRCLWYTDPDGTLCLAPGCMARAQDPDAECLCDSLTARHRRTLEELRALQARQRYAERWRHALQTAVDAHPDRQSIRADAQRRTGR
ncbi:hypothetical protein [Streptomyces sp. NBC_01237]|uniref:hypothetical protein n=1 Tax=Streptomyces sp. NBC_01237 TaxID=2903790 RepID=UPI002DD9557C|nr:hypothetical protein [Streptomyces sp. NBC_01237]WRZ76599.1 hypothetical protein OG251_36045 [Streptomyces sp. NBC_01237]